MEVMNSKAVELVNLTHQYGDRKALDAISLDVAKGEVMGLVGPNGGGKSTLFRILSTLMVQTNGVARIFGFDTVKEPARVRACIGAVFQSPALDKKLSAWENLIAQGYLYGLRGRELRKLVEENLKQLGVYERAREPVESLSGGMKRRIEIAKGLLHSPSLLLLDEPTTGLDPSVRHELWGHLQALNSEKKITLIATTHLMDEAELCHRIAFLDQGKIVADGSPGALRASVGTDIISVMTEDPDSLKEEIKLKFGVVAQVQDRKLRIEESKSEVLVSDLWSGFSDKIRSITLGKPTLDDFFIQKTGRRIKDEPEVNA